MTINSDEDVRRILRGICDHSLPKTDWTHAAHFAAAIAILRDPKFEAFEDMPKIIQAYNEATGVQNTDTGGYHHTITIVSLLAAKAILDGQVSSMLDALNQMMRGEFGQSDWVLEYWSEEVLFSKTARKTWVPPNLTTPGFSLSWS